MSTNRMKPYTITEIAAILTAVIALAVSIWEGVETRRHNRLSVRPALNFDVSYAHDGTVERIDLINQGTGPAIVKAFKVYIDGQLIEKSGSDVWAAAFQSLGLIDNSPACYWYETGEVIGINEKASLLNVVDEDGDEVIDSKTWTEAISKIKIIIEYASIYDEEFQVKFELSK